MKFKLHLKSNNEFQEEKGRKFSCLQKNRKFKLFSSCTEILSILIQ